MNASKAYNTLNLIPGSSHQEIKQAYRNLAKKYHPDTSESSETRKMFLEVNSAYRFLISKDPQELLIESQAKKEYTFTQTAPTDKKKYEWWKEEVIRRSKEEKHTPQDPQYIRFQEKQKSLAITLGRLLLFVLMTPLLLGVMYAFGYEVKNNSVTLYVVAMNFLCICIYFYGVSRKFKAAPSRSK